MSTRPDGQTRALQRSAARGLPPGSAHFSAYVGPPGQWDFMGATQFRLLTTLGLREHHRLLDVGCGSLRAGRLLIPYLDPGCYCGIEPNMWLVEDAIAAELGQEIIALRRARFSDRSDFDASGFGLRFDFILAQSVFSHAGPDMLGQALPKLAAALAPGGLILATFLRADMHPAVPVERPGWSYPGCIAYRAETLDMQLAAAGLTGRPLPWYHPRQSWYVIARAAADMPAPALDHHLGGAVLRAPEFAASLGGKP